MNAAGNGGIRGPQSTPPGGSVTVNVGTNDPTVQIVDVNTGELLGTANVEPGKDTTITLPNVPGGTIIQLVAGEGVKSQILEIEIISTGP